MISNEAIFHGMRDEDGALVCMVCGAIVHHEYVRTHDEWHGSLITRRDED